jgi:hypothetical protein
MLNFTPSIFSLLRTWDIFKFQRKRPKFKSCLTYKPSIFNVSRGLETIRHFYPVEKLCVFLFLIFFFFPFLVLKKSLSSVLMSFYLSNLLSIYLSIYLSYYHHYHYHYYQIKKIKIPFLKCLSVFLLYKLRFLNGFGSRQEQDWRWTRSQFKPCQNPVFYPSFSRKYEAKGPIVRKRHRF